ncbi:MAG: hypothetical protein H7195_02360 [Chryseobacterium sp.]|nr:hypothetical protein [Chryseobacterium sp.]
MKKYCFIILIIFLFSSCTISKVERENLKKELTTILRSDQDLRELFTNDITQERRSKILANYNISQDEFKVKGWKITEKNDSVNLIKVEKIVAKYGYPGIKLVGEKLHTTAWYVIQHSKLAIIEKYYPTIIKANKEGDLERTNVAMMEDRMHMYQGKMQIYGTQGAGRLFVDSISKKEEWTNFIWPIKDYSIVNELRKSVGFKTTMEEYSKALDIDYSKKYSLNDIKKLTK